MSVDYYLKYKDFLTNNDLYTFDETDTERVDLTALGLPIEEILFIAWLRGMRRDLVDTNLSIIAGFEGRHRSSKSTSACTIAYCIDPTFWDRMEHRIVKTPDELSQELRIIRDEDIHGAVIIIDEGGAVVPSDEYFSEWYKTLSRLFQIFGYLNPCIFFCALNRENVGAKFRKLFNFIISCKRKSNKYSKLGVYELSYNPMFRKYIHKSPEFLIAGQKFTLKNIKFGKPPEFILKRYITASTLQKTEMMDGYFDTIHELSKPIEKKKNEPNYPQIIESVVKNKSVFETPRSKPNKIILDPFRIQMKFKVKFREASYIKSEAEGILTNEIYEKSSKTQPKPDTPKTDAVLNKGKYYGN